jgi:hypothetical protein
MTTKTALDYQILFAKETQRDESAITITTSKRIAVINSRRRIDLGASVPAQARLHKQGAHTNPRS